MATQPLHDEGPELVTVFETMEESEAQVVRGLLQTEGNIEAIVSGRDFPPDVLPGVGGTIVRVPADRADEARAIIRQFREFGDSNAGAEGAEPR